jgi:uncharacterized protein (TIGR00255 family)
MTGFGVGEAPFLGGRLVAEVRSVNQRFLDVRVRLPAKMADLGGFAEGVLRERLKRGRVELVVQLEGTKSVAIELDIGRARDAIRQLSALRDEVAPGAELPLSLLGAVPDLFSTPGGGGASEARTALKTATFAAVDALDEMAAREGGAILADFVLRCRTIAEIVASLREKSATLTEAIRGRLRERAVRLFAGDASLLDSNRLEAEVLLLADKADVTEELTRLESHLAQFHSAAEARLTEPVGRRLDFLLQEMLREANTLGAKAQDAWASQQVVAMKVELERLREQVQNVE